MEKLNYNGQEYDYVVTSENPRTVEVHFDSHGSTKFTNVGGAWSVDDMVYLPKGSSINEIGKLIEND